MRRSGQKRIGVCLGVITRQAFLRTLADLQRAIGELAQVNFGTCRIDWWHVEYRHGLQHTWPWIGAHHHPRAFFLRDVQPAMAARAVVSVPAASTTASQTISPCAVCTACTRRTVLPLVASRRPDTGVSTCTTVPWARACWRQAAMTFTGSTWPSMGPMEAALTVPGTRPGSKCWSSAAVISRLG